MLSKATAKLIRSLKNKKYREEKGLFLIEGVRSCEEVLNSDLKIEGLYALETFISQHSNDLLAQQNLVHSVSNKELESLSLLKNSNEVVIVAHIPESEALTIKDNQFYLVLDDIRDPGNLGTIVRIADWFGISDIICSAECADLYNPKVIQASMGSFLRVKLHYDELSEILSENENSIYAASTRGTNLKEVPTPKGGMILIGNEAHGINSKLSEYVTQWISIPGKGGAESLNASVATGIICSHWVN